MVLAITGALPPNGFEGFVVLRRPRSRKFTSISAVVVVVTFSGWTRKITSSVSLKTKQDW